MLNLLHNIPTLAHNSYATHTHGQLNKSSVTMLLDSGAPCSVFSKDHVSPPNIKPVARTKLVNADGRNITLCGITTLTVALGPFSTKYSFIVVDHLSVSTILGCDFLRKHGLVLNFESGTYYRADCPNLALPLQVIELRSCSTITIDEDCHQAISVKSDGKDWIQLEMPTDVHLELKPAVQEFEEFFPSN